MKLMECIKEVKKTHFHSFACDLLDKRAMTKRDNDEQDFDYKPQLLTYELILPHPCDKSTVNVHATEKEMDYILNKGWNNDEILNFDDTAIDTYLHNFVNKDVTFRKLSALIDAIYYSPIVEHVDITFNEIGEYKDMFGLIFTVCCGTHALSRIYRFYVDVDRIAPQDFWDKFLNRLSTGAAAAMFIPDPRNENSCTIRFVCCKNGDTSWNNGIDQEIDMCDFERQVINSRVLCISHGDEDDPEHYTDSTMYVRYHNSLGFDSYEYKKDSVSGSMFECYLVNQYGFKKFAHIAKNSFDATGDTSKSGKAIKIGNLIICDEADTTVYVAKDLGAKQVKISFIDIPFWEQN